MRASHSGCETWSQARSSVECGLFGEADLCNNLSQTCRRTTDSLDVLVRPRGAEDGAGENRSKMRCSKRNRALWCLWWSTVRMDTSMIFRERLGSAKDEKDAGSWKSLEMAVLFLQPSSCLARLSIERMFHLRPRCGLFSFPMHRLACTPFSLPHHSAAVSRISSFPPIVLARC